MTGQPDRNILNIGPGDAVGAYTAELLKFYDFFLQTQGVLAATELTIAAGSVTATQAAHTVDTEADAAADDLTHIDQTNLPDGFRVMIRAVDAARVTTVKHNQAGAGEILMVDGADFVLNAIDKFLILERRGTAWTEIRRWYGADKAAFRAFLGLVVGIDVLAPNGDPNALDFSGLTVGARTVSYDLGNLNSATTLSISNGTIQHGTMTGAFTLTAPNDTNEGGMAVELTVGGAGGYALGVSGFAEVSGTFDKTLGVVNVLKIIKLQTKTTLEIVQAA